MYVGYIHGCVFTCVSPLQLLCVSHAQTPTLIHLLCSHLSSPSITLLSTPKGGQKAKSHWLHRTGISSHSLHHAPNKMRSFLWEIGKKPLPGQIRSQSSSQGKQLSQKHLKGDECSHKWFFFFFPGIISTPFKWLVFTPVTLQNIQLSSSIHTRTLLAFAACYLIPRLLSKEEL